MTAAVFMRLRVTPSRPLHSQTFLRASCYMSAGSSWNYFKHFFTSVVHLSLLSFLVRICRRLQRIMISLCPWRNISPKFNTDTLWNIQKDNFTSKISFIVSRKSEVFKRKMLNVLQTIFFVYLVFFYY